MTSQTPHGLPVPASRSGVGPGDHDVAYVFGRRPTTQRPFPFSTRELARLLVLRSRVEAGLVGADDGVSKHV